MIPASSLEVRGVGFAYGDGPLVLDDVSFSVAAGETVAVMGPSGCGKTTLLKVLAGLRPASSGTVVRRGTVGYIPQQLGLVRTRTVLDNALAGALSRIGAVRGLFGAFPPAEEEAALAVLGRVGLAEKAHERAGNLSGGERQRVAIARTLLQRPAVLLADEFTANLDIVKAGQVLDVVREEASRGVAVVLALHNLALAREYADRVLFLRAGRLAEAVPAELLTDERARGLLA